MAETKRRHRSGGSPRPPFGQGRESGIKRGISWSRWCLWPAFVAAQAIALVAVILLAALWLLKDRLVPLPRTVAQQIETLAEAALETELVLGALSVTAEGAGILRLVAEDVHLIGPDGADRAQVPRASVELGLRIGWPLAPEARALEVQGAVLSLVRREDGSLDLGSDVLSAIFSRAPPRTVVEAADRVRTGLGRPGLADLQSIVFEDLSFGLDDRRAGRVWRAPDAALHVDRLDGNLSITLALQEPGRVTARATLPEEGPLALEIAAQIDGVPAEALATQIPALVWLEPLDAGVSGALRGHYAPDGLLQRLDGTLDIGAGHLTAGAGGQTAFDRAKAYFTYRPDPAQVTFSRLELDAAPGRFVAEGRAYLHGSNGAWADALSGQLTLTEALLTKAPGRAGPVAISGGALDAYLKLSPFDLTIGQLVLLADSTTGEAPVAGAAPRRLELRGHVHTVDGGLAASLSAAVPEMTPPELLGFWPVDRLPGTRAWLARNLIAGDIADTEFGIELRPGAAPKAALSFLFRDATVRAFGEFPPITRGAGRASLQDDRFALSVEAGQITPPDGGTIDVAGSDFTILNTRQRPGRAQVTWRSRSPVGAALSLIDQPPLRLMTRARQPVDLAEGEIALEGRLAFPVRNGVTFDDVAFDFAGRLTDVRSSTLVPGRRLEADALRLDLSPEALEIAGPVTLDDVPADATYAQTFGSGENGGEVRATAEVSADAAAAFGVTLPPGTLSGAARAEVVLDLPDGGPTALTLTSDLRGLGLSVPAVRWSKPANTAGALRVDLRLPGQGRPPQVDRIALAAPGLDIEGRIDLTPEGGLRAATLERARIGEWLDAPVTLRGAGAGGPLDIALAGGRADLRGLPLEATGNGSSGPGAGVALRGRLDRLILTEDVALTDLRLDLSQAPRLSGRISGLVNGRAPVTGTLSSGDGAGPVLRVTAADAGQVLAAAGAFEAAQGGALDLTLRPEASSGRWRGSLAVDGMRVTAAPGLAAVLNTISVIGILDQLNGPGLSFTTIRSDFRLTPGGVEITSASAVGPSLGISAAGIYEAGSGRLDLRGVLSPIYFVNAIGQLFTREGEGLFGMTYTVNGSVQSPEVRVNPLAILTPGAFREIFQAPPPTLPGQSGQ